MAIAGRSYPNVPVVVRGSLEDPSDFNSKTGTVVSAAQPSAAQTAVPPVTILRSTLADPPVLTTTSGTVVAAQPDRRWFAPATLYVARSTLADPVVLTTAAPVVIAAQPDPRWLTGALTVVAGSSAPVVTASASGVVTPLSLAMPKVSQTGSWWQLLDIRKHAQEEFDFYASRPPMSCPRCGEPLLNAPPTDAGSDVELYCRFDGWRYPGDWVRPLAT